MNSEPTIDDGMQAHLAGQLEEAERIYLEALARVPKQETETAQIWHLLAAVRHQMGKVSEAQQNALQAVALMPQFPEALNTLGSIQKELGQLDEAEQSFQSALELFADFPQALTNLAEVRRLGKAVDEALRLNHQALKLAPDLAPAHNNMGAAKLDAGDLEGAVAAFKQALVFDSSLDDARLNLAGAQRQKGDAEEARALVADLLERQHDNAAALNLMGTIHFDSGIYRQAQACLEKALSIDVDLIDAHNNLGNTLVRLNRLSDAVDCFAAALSRKPDFVNALANQAAAFLAMGRVDDALSACQQAMALEGNHTDAHWNRGLARLISGDLTGGFADYEWRWQLPEFVLPYGEHNLWQGQNLSGKTLLVHSEQGFGDTLQMARYLPLLAEKGARLVVVTHQPLVTILAQSGIADVVLAKDSDIPAFDYHLPIMSLPLRFGTTLDSIPPAIDFFAEETGDQLTFDSGTELKIGLVWAGRPTHKNDQNRSIPLELFDQIAGMEDIGLVSLQVGIRADDLAAMPWRDGVRDVGRKLKNFYDTAQIINQLDLVITVDTAVAHLAGSMAKNCWVLLPYAPDWRWLQERDDSPWYESVTLFRQKAPPTALDPDTQWRPVINRVLTALEARTGV